MQTFTNAQVQKLITLHKKHVSVMEELYEIIGIQNRLLNNISKQAELFSKDHAAIKKELAILKEELGKKTVHKKLPIKKK
jgi:hypothetical protein